MQRTKKCRGAKAFELRSGTKSPYPLLKGIGNALLGGIGKAFGGKGDGSGITGGGDNSIGARLDRIEAAVTDNSAEGDIVNPDVKARKDEEILKSNV
jgi:hypothetical protein